MSRILLGMAAMTLAANASAENCYKNIRVPHRDHEVSIGQAGYKILQYSQMPAVLLENFNLANYDQMRMWDDPETRGVFIESYVQAILDYRKENPSLEKVILDNSHGAHDPGAVDTEHNTGKTERDYVLLIREELSSRLAQEGLHPIKLDYDGPTMPVKRRLEELGERANKLGDSKDSIYLSLHTDTLHPDNAYRTTWAPPPKPFVYCQRSKNTDILAEKLAKRGYDAFLKVNSIDTSTVSE